MAPFPLDQKGKQTEKELNKLKTITMQKALPKVLQLCEGKFKIMVLYDYTANVTTYGPILHIVRLVKQ